MGKELFRWRCAHASYASDTREAYGFQKSLIDECHLGDTVELSVVDGSLLVRPVTAPRQDWDHAFEQMAEAGDDGLLDPETQTEFDATEWEWPEG